KGRRRAVRGAGRSVARAASGRGTATTSRHRPGCEPGYAKPESVVARPGVSVTIPHDRGERASGKAASWEEETRAGAGSRRQGANTYPPFGVTVFQVLAGPALVDPLKVPIGSRRQRSDPSEPRTLPNPVGETSAARPQRRAGPDCGGYSRRSSRAVGTL